MLHESYIGSRRARFSLAPRKSAMPFIYGLFIWPPGSMTTVMRNASAWLICWRVNARTPVMTCPKALLRETHEQRSGSEIRSVMAVAWRVRCAYPSWEMYGGGIRSVMAAAWRVRNMVGDDCGVAG